MNRKLVIALAMLVLLAGLFAKVKSLNSYQIEGHIVLDVFDANVTVYRDKVGIPYVFAQSTSDLIKAQGFLVAQDRVLQVELYRALINGQLASLIGESGLDSDIQMRVLNLRGNAERQYKLLSPEDREFLSWYAEGYNAFLKHRTHEYPLELGLLGLSASAIHAVDLLSVLNYAGFIHSKNYQDEILTQQLVNALGAAKASELLPLNINLDRLNAVSEQTSTRLEMNLLDGVGASAHRNNHSQLPIALPASGSNNWVTGPAKSAGGQPILSNDPHLDARILPGPWYPIGLFSPDFNAIGANLPGVPGLLTGRTDNVAFGITNAYGDSQDLYLEQLAPENSDHYLESGQPHSFAVRLEQIDIKDSDFEGGYRTATISVRSTSRGPIISDHAVFGVESEQPISLRWALFEIAPAALGITEFLAAENINELDRAVQQVELLYLNFVFADIEGGIGYRSSGAVPIREHGSTLKLASVGDDWKGYIPGQEMPGLMNPEKGWLGTSNHDVVPDDYPYYYSNHFSPYYRYQRTSEHMESTSRLSNQDHWQLILDVKNKHAERLVPRIVQVLKSDPKTTSLAQLLATWDFRDEVDSSAATVFHLLHEKLVRSIFADELPNDLLESFLSSRYYWLQRVDEFIVSGDSSFIDDVTTERVERLHDLIMAAAQETNDQLTQLYGADSNEWQWGKFHSLKFLSPLRQEGWGAAWLGQGSAPAAGSGETLNRGQYSLSNGPYESQWFSSLRMVADLSDDEKVMAVVSGGSAARQFHPFFKSQLGAWRAEKWLPWWFDKKQIEKHQAAKLEIRSE